MVNAIGRETGVSIRRCQNKQRGEWLSRGTTVFQTGTLIVSSLAESPVATTERAKSACAERAQTATCECTGVLLSHRLYKVVVFLETMVCYGNVQHATHAPMKTHQVLPPTRTQRVVHRPTPRFATTKGAEGTPMRLVPGKETRSNREHRPFQRVMQCL